MALSRGSGVSNVPNGATDPSKEGSSPSPITTEVACRGLAEMQSAEGVDRDHINSHRVALLGGRTLDIDLIREAATGPIERVKELLDQGADPNFRDERTRGSTALMRAASWGRADVVTALLDGGADPNIVSENGNTALQSALEGDKPDITKILLSAGANSLRKK